MLTMKETDARTLRPDAPDEELIRKLKARFQALHEVRRGVCLLNAGKYEDAAAAFSRASVHGGTDGTLASYLAACHMARGNPSAAAEQLAPELDDPETDVVQFIRTALAAWAAEARDDAIRILREGVSNYPESAELHFQLGILLADMDEVEEAELRFVQALNIDRDHRDALVSLAMCCGMRSAPADAVRHLKRAQSRHPRDARIALLLAQAAAAAEQQGHMVSLSAIMPAEDALEEREGIEELARVIADDPDFVDAFISIPVREVDSSVFAVLLRTLETALEHQPEHRGASLPLRPGTGTTRPARRGDRRERARGRSESPNDACPDRPGEAVSPDGSCHGRHRSTGASGACRRRVRGCLLHAGQPLSRAGPTRPSQACL